MNLGRRTKRRQKTKHWRHSLLALFTTREQGDQTNWEDIKREFGANGKDKKYTRNFSGNPERWNSLRRLRQRRNGTYY